MTFKTLTRYAHKCHLCSPRYLHVTATTKASAIDLIKRGADVRMYASNDTCFVVSKREALKKIRDLPADNLPGITHLMGSTPGITFIR